MPHENTPNEAINSDLDNSNLNNSNLNNSNLEFNQIELERYFNFLGNEQELYTGCFLTADAKAQQPGFGVVHGSATELIEEAAKVYTDSKATLHVCLNRTNLSGRKLKDIQACRVLCVDIDEVTEREVIRGYVTTYKPQLIVESSPGKFHIYWKISATTPLVLWSKIQKALAFFFHGDPHLAQINKTIRVPGIARLTKDGTVFLPRIVYLSDNTSDNTDELTNELEDITAVKNLFPQFDDWLLLAEKEQSKWDKTLKNALAKGNYQRVAQLAGNGHGRNSTLYEAVAQKVAETGTLTREDSLEFGEFVNKQFAVPLDSAEVLKTVDSAWRHGVERFECREERIKQEQKQLLGMLDTPLVGTNGHGRANSEPVNQASPKADAFVYDYTDPFLRQNRFTDKGVIARVLQRFGKLMLKVGKDFYAFSERDCVWRLQDSRDHTELYSFYETAIQDTVTDPNFIREMCLNQRGEFSRTAKRTAEERFWSNRLHLSTVSGVRSSGKIKRTSIQIFDSTPPAIYCGNGVLDMKLERLRDACAEDYLLKCTPINWNQEAKCNWWISFLHEVFAENENTEAMVNFMQEVFGYSLSGHINEQKLFCHYGDGSNGKSKVLKALALIGGSYATWIDSDDLARPKQGFTKALERIGAKVEGHRIAIIDDISTQTVWNEAFVKNLTSDTMRARAEYEQSRVTANRAKMHLGLNKAPLPESENYGMLRRLCIIPYVRQFEPNSTMSDLIDSKIREEAEGILVWAVKGYQRLSERKKIHYPPELQAAVQEYKQEHFSVETVLGELFELDSSEQDTNYEFISDLLDDVNTRLEQDGSSQRIEINELVHAIKRKFKVSTEKKWDAKRKNAYRAFPLKLKFERSVQHTDIL